MFGCGPLADPRPQCSGTMSRWRRQLAQQPDRWPTLPLRPGPASNGEFLPAARSSRDRRLELAVLERVAIASDRVGMERRRLLQTSGGIAALLATYNLAACSGDGERDGASAPGSTSSTSPSTRRAARSRSPEPEDVEACEQQLATGADLIFDIHTHHVVPDGLWRQNSQRIVDNPSRLQEGSCPCMRQASESCR